MPQGNGGNGVDEVAVVVMMASALWYQRSCLDAQTKIDPRAAMATVLAVSPCYSAAAGTQRLELRFNWCLRHEQDEAPPVTKSSLPL